MQRCSDDWDPKLVDYGAAGTTNSVDRVRC